MLTTASMSTVMPSTYVLNSISSRLSTTPVLISAHTNAYTLLSPGAKCPSLKLPWKSSSTSSESTTTAAIPRITMKSPRRGTTRLKSAISANSTAGIAGSSQTCSIPIPRYSPACRAAAAAIWNDFTACAPTT